MGPHFFKCGKTLEEGAVWTLDGKASMGPHFFKCGKHFFKGFNGDALFQLQWGRTFSSAESHPARRLPFWECISFNGAALFQVRKAGRCAEPSSARRSFNGAALFQVRKDKERKPAGTRPISASMGPHFFKCGKEIDFCKRNFLSQRFNGAALFQVRKGTLADGASWSLDGLQWGRTFSSAERAIAG